MAKRPKKEHDFSITAFKVVEEATHETKDEEHTSEKDKPDMAALGRLGGKKGGPARAKKLTPEQRQKIAKKAAMTRWRPQPRA